MQKHMIILCFLLGSSPASELYIPTFRNTLSVPSSLPMKMEQIECSETSAYIIQTPVNYPKKNIFRTRRKFEIKNTLILKTEILYLKANVTLLYYRTTKSDVRHTHMHLEAIPICVCYRKPKWRLQL